MHRASEGRHATDATNSLGVSLSALIPDMRRLFLTLLTAVSCSPAGDGPRVSVAETSVAVPATASDTADRIRLPADLDTMRLAELPAEELFAQGRRLLEANCGDCMGATVDSLHAGLAYVQRALATGYRDSAAAQQLLTEGYANAAYRYAESESARTAWEQRLRDAHALLARLRANDFEVQIDFARTRATPAERLAAYRQLRARDSMRVAIEGLLASALIELDSLDAAMVHIRRVALLGDPRDEDDALHIRRLCADLAVANRTEPKLAPVCAGRVPVDDPVYHVGWRVGEVWRTPRGQPCLAIANAGLEAGARVIIVVPGEQLRVDTAVVVAAQQEPCTHPRDSGSQLVSEFRGSMYILDGNAAPDVGIGIVGPVSVSIDDGTASADLDGDSRRESFVRCEKEAGVFLSILTGTAVRWRAFFYGPHVVRRRCADA